MTHLIDLYNFCFSAPSEVGNDNTKFEDSIEAIESQYPEDCDKVRLWRDIKKHRYVKALKEYRFLDQKVLMEPVWPEHKVIQNMLTRLYDNKRKVYADLLVITCVIS